LNTICLLDTETTGLSPATERVIEVAVTLFDLDTASPIQSFASLIRHDSNAAENINNIPVAALLKAPLPDQVWKMVQSLTGAADIIIAHRVEFDQPFVEAELLRSAIGKPTIPWVCSKFDLKWPKQTREGGSLVALALEHGLGVSSAHRASTDVDILTRLFARAHELGADLREMMKYGLRPKGKIQALVSYDDREQAKKAGFQWDGEKKIWTKRMALEDAEKLGFKWKRIDGLEDPQQKML